MQYVTHHILELGGDGVGPPARGVVLDEGRLEPGTHTASCTFWNVSDILKQSQKVFLVSDVTRVVPGSQVDGVTAAHWVSWYSAETVLRNISDERGIYWREVRAPEKEAVPGPGLI